MLYHADTGRFFRDRKEAQSALKILSPDLQEVAAKPIPDVPSGHRAVRSPEPFVENGAAWWAWTVEPIPAEQISLTRLQFALACLGAGIITAGEAEEFASGGALPQVALDALTSITDVTTRTVARIRFRSADRIDRTNEFIPVLQASLGLTDAQVDDLFRAGVAI